LGVYIPIYPPPVATALSVWRCLTGSPFMVNVGGEKSGRSRETITRQIQSAELVSIGQKCDLKLKLPGRSFTNRLIWWTDFDWNPSLESRRFRKVFWTIRPNLTLAYIFPQVSHL